MVSLANNAGFRDSSHFNEDWMFKEFVGAVLSEACDPKWGLFKELKDHSLILNPDSSKFHPELHVIYFELIGKIVGKMMLEGILVNPPFNKLFLKILVKNVNVDITPNDLIYLDTQLYSNLFSLKHFQGDLSELDLYFVATNESGKEVELKPGGKDVQVNCENVEEYIDLMVDYSLHTNIGDQVEAFKHGFLTVMDRRKITLFDEEELQFVMSGSIVKIDISDLKANTKYGGFEEDDPLILAFWQIVTRFNDELRKELLKFVMGTSRVLVGGFKNLIPSFTIAQLSVKSFPTSLTYENMLGLPYYHTKRKLKEKLISGNKC